MCPNGRAETLASGPSYAAPSAVKLIAWLVILR
jgi:hypothetical protein